MSARSAGCSSTSRRRSCVTRRCRRCCSCRSRRAAGCCARCTRLPRRSPAAKRSTPRTWTRPTGPADPTLTVTAPAAPHPAEAASERPGRSRAPVIAAAVGAGLLVLSTALVLWAKTRPGFDPYGWLVWGHQTLEWSLNTNAAPSWKPLPYLLTVPYALAGHYEMWLWLTTAVALSLSGAIFAGRIAYRLTDAPADRRWAAWVAAVVAGLASLGIV